MLGHAVVVLSDAHLAPSTPLVEERLLAFLARVPAEGDALLVNGDLFDFWFTYRRVIPRHGFRVAAALARLAERVPVVLVGGNHDRWDDGFWVREAGIAFHPQGLRFEVGARRVLAAHGDGLTDPRWHSRLAHRLVSSPLTRWTYRALHPDLGFPLVARLAPHLGDGAETPARRAAGAARQAAWAERTLRADPTLGAVVLGHTHQPALAEPEPGRVYLNPGAWFDGGRYALLTERGAELRQLDG